MYNFKIGAIVDSFRVDTFEAIRRAAKIGVDGIQMYASAGENSPEQMTSERKKNLISAVKDSGIVFSAICGDLGKGFGNPALNPSLIEKSKRIVDLALELGTNIVTTHIGVVPSDSNHERYKIMQEACFTLANYADSVGARFAVETGPEKSEILKGFLDSLGSKGVSVNLDPANLVMVAGDDPVAAVHNLKDYIVHTHAKDGNMLIKTNPECIYGVTEMPEGYEESSFFEEVPLGNGSVDFPKYIAALDEIGYHGFLTIEREVGPDPAGDIAMAYNFLKNIIR